jgi:hypothetical protein
LATCGAESWVSNTDIANGWLLLKGKFGEEGLGELN